MKESFLYLGYEVVVYTVEDKKKNQWEGCMTLRKSNSLDDAKSTCFEPKYPSEQEAMDDVIALAKGEVRKKPDADPE